MFSAIIGFLRFLLAGWMIALILALVLLVIILPSRDPAMIVTTNDGNTIHATKIVNGIGFGDRIVVNTSTGYISIPANFAGVKRLAIVAVRRSDGGFMAAPPEYMLNVEFVSGRSVEGITQHFRGLVVNSPEVGRIVIDPTNVVSIVKDESK
jgi:hypothetical protein